MHLQRAAVRKLGHELGISKEQLPMKAFKYLTRLHYCAADTDTYGPNAEWGEHEVWLLCLACPTSAVIVCLLKFLTTDSLQCSHRFESDN